MKSRVHICIDFFTWNTQLQNPDSATDEWERSQVIGQKVIT